ncbi:hypothetical protein TanjilG_21395 [Lupinus angustifolius]|uniref:SET domain-containing protein n=1 Tax=Lupinus angustifolius TaxID=3871 RepID=A0A4P1RNF6_LUPAN|nr:hypothetical protein TanjilG_21395 [Lupinus angustifolius]
MEVKFPSNVNNDNIPVCSTTWSVSYVDRSFCGYMQHHAFVSGWMYVNEHEQMCDPYIEEQLYEGLTTGFLPQELHVYPLVNGALMNLVPLNYFKQSPDHVSTGFAYLSLGISGTIMPSICSSSSCKDMTVYGHDRSFGQCAPLDVKSDLRSHINYRLNESKHLSSNLEADISEESCWLYEDENEFLTEKKRKNHKLESSEQASETCMLDSKNSKFALEISKGTSIPSKLASSHILVDQTCHEISRLSSTIVKSVGAIKNIWWSYVVVRKVPFDYCMQVMWNAVFFGTFVDYLFFWRKRKLWSNPKTQLVNGRGDYVEKIKSEVVSTLLTLGKTVNASKGYLNDSTSRLGRTVEGAKISSVVPLVSGKLTYYRKKLARKELCSSPSVSLDDSDPGKQHVAKLRKHAFGNFDKTTKVKITSTNSGKTRMIKMKRMHLMRASLLLSTILLAFIDGDLLKVPQMKARKKNLRFQRSKIHDWGLVALEPIEAEDFVIEYIGELIRPQYEKMGIGGSYHFRIDDDYVMNQMFCSPDLGIE